MKKGRIYAILMSILLLGVIPSVNQDATDLYTKRINQIPNLLESLTEQQTPIVERVEYVEPPTQSSSSVQKITDYIEGTRIEILSNDDFGPSNYNFPGSGAQNDPYVIEGYSIADSSGTLIHIENTTAYFVIQNCILDGINRGHDGIYCKNVSSGIISNNILVNNDVGCLLVNATNNIIENNMISVSNLAIWFYWNSGNNSVINNRIQNTINGISVSPYSNSRIFDNIITEITSTGIAISSDSSADVRNNTLSNIGGNGIYSGWATGNVKIIGNKIANTSLASIELSNTHYGSGIVISNNTILNSKQQGILFGFNDDNVPIMRNTIFNCTGYAIDFSVESDGNEVTWNNFFHNNKDGQQVIDRGVGNFFSHNYWNDWIGPDNDVDGIVDMPYSINTDKMGMYFDDSSDYANLANFPLSDTFSFELWVNLRDITSSQCIIGKHDSTGGVNIFLLFISNGFLLIYDRISASYVNLGSISPGWQHFAVIISQEAASYDYFVYQNGTHFANGTRATTIGNNPSDRAWTLGQDWDGGTTTDHFYGWTID